MHFYGKGLLTWAPNTLPRMKWPRARRGEICRKKTNKQKKNINKTIKKRKQKTNGKKCTNEQYRANQDGLRTSNAFFITTAVSSKCPSRNRILARPICATSW